MKRLCAKLKNNSGESLGEVLIALLVSALAVVMLASMISSSVSVINTSRNKLKNYYEDSALANPPVDAGKQLELSIKLGDQVLDAYRIQYADYHDLGRNEIISYVPASTP